MNYIDYRKQLGISWNDQDNIKAFKNKVVNTLIICANDVRAPYIDKMDFLSFSKNANISYSEYGNRNESNNWCR